MSDKKEGKTGRKSAGIRLNYLNFTMICIGMLIAVLMVYSTYRTTSSVKEIVTVTDNYLTYQQTGGMLRDFAERLGGIAEAFVQSPDPGQAKSYEAQLNVINAQLADYTPEQSVSDAANEQLSNAIFAFRSRNDTEAHAMRLAADVLPKGAFEALPDLLKNIPLNDEEQAMTPPEKTEAALALLQQESYTGFGDSIRTAVDNSHRLSSEAGRQQAEETSGQVNNIMTAQNILVALLILIAAATLVINRLLIITPIQKSVDNLDRREPIPVRGSYEMRRMAQAYNDLLKENEEKTKALSYTATHDALTGLLNRAAFDKAYRAVHRDQIALLIADVDHFKQYNDEFGHDIGDKVLQMAAEALKRHFRDEDQICRIGGDEFCIIMPGICQNRAESVRDRMIRINAELAEMNDQLPPVTLSAGIACWDRPNPLGSVFTDADHVLLELKKTRDTCCAIYRG